MNWANLVEEWPSAVPSGLLSELSESGLALWRSAVLDFEQELQNLTLLDLHEANI